MTISDVRLYGLIGWLTPKSIALDSQSEVTKNLEEVRECLVELMSYREDCGRKLAYRGTMSDIDAIDALIKILGDTVAKVQALQDARANG